MTNMMDILLRVERLAKGRFSDLIKKVGVVGGLMGRIRRCTIVVVCNSPALMSIKLYFPFIEVWD